MASVRKLLPDDQADLVNQALSDARKKTSAIILPIIAGTTDRYDKAEDMLGLWAAALGLALTWVLFSGAAVGQEWSGDVGTSRAAVAPIIGAVAAGFLAGVLIASRIGWLRRLFIPRRQMLRRVEARAEELLHHQAEQLAPQDRDRVLLVYVSMYEKLVSLVCGDAVKGKLTEADGDAVRHMVVAGLTHHKIGEGLRDAVARAAEALAPHYPAAPDAATSSRVAVTVLE